MSKFILSEIPRRGVWLYFFCFYGRENEPLGPVKIGITENVPARLKSVQTGQHRKLDILAIFTTPNRDIARARESDFHKFYADKRLEGEWFDIDPIVALEDACRHWRHYFQNIPEFLETLEIPQWEREVKVLRCWRQHYAETSNVRAMAQVG